MSGFKNGGYDLTWTQASRWHGRDNCCDPSQDNFLDRIWTLHVQPAGFDRRDHPSKAVLSVIGPGLRERSTDVLFNAIRNPPLPKASRQAVR